jgi:hypothetical protein
LINGRAKGLAFERDIIRLLKDELGEVASHLKRELDQYREADCGDIRFDPWIIECKRYSGKGMHGFPSDAWWNQACRAAGQNIPVLVYKFDRQPIRVMVPLDILTGGEIQNLDRKAIISFEDFVMQIRENL